MAPNINALIQSMLDSAKWRKQILADYEASTTRLLKAYQRVTPRIEPDIAKLSDRLTEYADANDGELPDIKRVKGWAQYQDLLDTTEREMQSFSNVAEAEAGDLADKAIELGILAAASMVLATAGSSAGLISQVWQRPNVDAVRIAAGFVNSDAFRQKAATFGANAAQNLGDVILAGVSQGRGIDTTVRILTNWLAVPYSWAHSTVTTAQMQSYREANRQSYLTNPQVVEKWVWWAALDDVTCMSCISMHGSTHDLNETLDSHHQCRCTMIPLVTGSTWLDGIQTGSDWFSSQSEATQKSMLGPGRYDLYSSGKWDWSAASQPYEDDVYGVMRRASTLSEMAGE